MPVVPFSDKVDRCTTCNTFVRKGDAHGPEECNNRIVRKQQAKSSPSGKKRRYRCTPKMQQYMVDFIIAYAPTERKRKAALRRLKL